MQCKWAAEKLKMAQIKADDERVSENHIKEVHIKEKGKLMDAKIDGLSVENLNQQLDFHHKAEKKSPTAVRNTEKVPLKSHVKNKQDQVCELKKAVARHAL